MMAESMSNGESGLCPVRRYSVTLVSVLIALLVSLCTFSDASAAEQSGAPAEVRAGYFYNGDFMHKDDSGMLSGYDIEYYYMLAGYADWQVRFVEYGSLNDALAALKAGDIDVMSGLSRTDERVNSFLVANQKMCTARIAVQTRFDDDRFTVGDTLTMQDMTCGILKGSNVVALYRNWCEGNGLTPHITEYDSLEARNVALKAGEVDAIAGGSTIEGAQKIAEFPSLDLYFMFNRSRSDLKAQLDRAMSLLSLQNPSFATDLFEKYFPVSRNLKPSFSAAEKLFLAGHPVLRVAVPADDAPFSSPDPKGGFRGILPDYFAHLSEVVGSDFECVSFADIDSACAALADGKVDLIGKFQDDPFQANSRNMLLSVPFLKMNMVEIMRAGTRTAAHAAAPQCNAELAAAMIGEMGASLDLTACANGVKSFEALKQGAADAVICTQPTATWLLNRNRASDYTVSAFGSETWNGVCAFSYGSDGNTLRSIMNKVITVDGGRISQIIAADTLEDSRNLARLLDHLPVSVIAGLAVLAVVFLIIAVTALIVLIRRRKIERKLEMQRAEIAAAEKISRARHLFFGTISHDMRTPLNGIMGFTDIALKSSDPEEVRSCLGKIHLSGTILTNLVSDMLIMSRMENGKYILKQGPCETGEIFREVVEPVRELADEKGIRFTDNIADIRSRHVIADRLSLQKILLNLLSNALKYTPAGGSVALTCLPDPADGAHPDSVIEVSDTGCGISPEFLPHVFEPFSQENPVNADTLGSGMGLSIVKSIVDAMGGTIQVRSEQGRGSVFTVRLHFREDEQAVSAAGDGGTADTACLQGKRALICEDNAFNREILKSILNHYGMETVEAENGKRGTEIFAAAEPGFFDVIFLDLRMPVMDGKTAARAIREMKRSDAGTVPIFAVTADAYPENVQECLAAGMNGHVSKPIDRDRLIGLLTGIFAGRK